jgi:biopolymer transport protein ExbB
MSAPVVLASANIIDQFAVAFEAMGAAWVMWLLIVLSVLSVAVMIERALYFATHSLGDVTALADKLQKGDLEGAAKDVEKKRGLEAEVVRQGVAAAPQGPASVEKVVQMVIKDQRLKYERFLSFLGTLGNNAPFIGLFGTVLGIISAFAELAKSAKAGSMTSGGSNIMAGISEALVATAVGLLVALPAVALYNVFARWLKTIAARGEVLGDALAAHLESVSDEPAPSKAASSK